MFVILLSAAMLATSAPVPRDDQAVDLLKVGERIGRLEVMMTWARTIVAEDAEPTKAVGEMKQQLADVKTAARLGKVSRRQVDSLDALEVTMVGILEIHLAGRGELTKSFKEMKDQLKKEWQIEKK
jgi:hypothetical protein